jgi:hypothetical protein
MYGVVSRPRQSMEVNNFQSPVGLRVRFGTVDK